MQKPRLLFLLCFGFINFVIAERHVACPFNPTCDCVLNGPSRDTFSSAICQLQPDMPTFTGFGRYTIDGPLTIIAKVNKIGSHAFAPFYRIKTLILNHTGGPGEEQADWDEDAFMAPYSRLVIDNFQIISLCIFPIPKALKQIGNMKSLAVQKCPQKITLIADDMANNTFLQMEQLSIDQTQIVEIDDRAFIGLEKSLFSLKLTSNSLTKFPDQALNILGYLQDLTIENSPISAIDLDSFKNLSHGVQKVDLSGCAFTAIPHDQLRRLKYLNELDLSKNKINILKPDDVLNYAKIDLSSNPIIDIPLNIFKSVRDLNLQNTMATSIDLSAFVQVSTTKLDNTPSLKTLTVSIVPNPTPTGLIISIENTGLENISPKIKDLLFPSPYYAANTLSTLSIANNIHLICTPDMIWMLPYIDYPAGSGLLNITNTICANSGVLLHDYLTSTTTTIPYTRGPTTPVNYGKFGPHHNHHQ